MFNLYFSAGVNKNTNTTYGYRFMKDIFNMRRNGFGFIILFVMFHVFPVIAVAEDFNVDAVLLMPGDSRSIEFEYNGSLFETGSYHMAMITAVVDDGEIHQLTIQIYPKGDMGSETAYFTWGMFMNPKAGALGGFKMLDPRYTYVYKDVRYVVNVNPSMTTGFLFSAVGPEYSHFDFPLEMTMTLTV
jgi:hypothetical protein